jgi:predicted nucleic acid-binding protein
MARVVFADAHFYIALLIVNDPHHVDALALSAMLERDDVWTSEPVLVEVLAYASRGGRQGRALAVDLVDRLSAHARTTIVPQTPELFRAGLDLYRRRLDKSYSLTDCMSMSICEEQGITQVLTHDRHFEQEGYEILM